MIVCDECKKPQSNTEAITQSKWLKVLKLQFIQGNLYEVESVFCSTQCLHAWSKPTSLMGTPVESPAGYENTPIPGLE